MDNSGSCGEVERYSHTTWLGTKQCSYKDNKGKITTNNFLLPLNMYVGTITLDERMLVKINVKYS